MPTYDRQPFPEQEQRMQRAVVVGCCGAGKSTFFAALRNSMQQEQLEGSLHTLKIKVDEEANKKINEIFPGHKTAPEDYAW
jgi:adenylate kinase family enzyme